MLLLLLLLSRVLVEEHILIYLLFFFFAFWSSLFHYLFCYLLFYRCYRWQRPTVYRFKWTKIDKSKNNYLKLTLYLHTHTQYTICCKFTEITADFHFSSDLKNIYFLLLLSDPHTHTLLLYLFSFLFCGAVVFVKISYCTHKKNYQIFFLHFFT